MVALITRVNIVLMGIVEVRLNSFPAEKYLPQITV
jgi:hypothetical protein